MIDTEKTVSIYSLFIAVLLAIMFADVASAQATIPVGEPLNFISESITLAGTLYAPATARAAIVIVHGSGQETRMDAFAEQLAKHDLAVLTYDKRGVGASGGVYAGPEVGTNNIDSTNLCLLAKDASAAVRVLQERHPNLPIGLVGFSQAGWIIPIAAAENSQVNFMVLFSCPTITTLEQLRFQFYTDGDTDFWTTHTTADAREHTLNDPDRYQFVATDPKDALADLAIPGLWLFGQKDIQLPVSMCIEQLNTFKAQGKPYEYALFPALGHGTAFADDPAPVAIALHWIKRVISSEQRG